MTVREATRWGWVVGLSLLLATADSRAAPARPAWEPAKTWALLVGVLEWEDPALAPFPKKGRVDRILENTLVARGVPPSQITFLEDRQATTKACKDALDRVADAAGEGSTLLFYFAGHGLQQGKQTWFAPFDADPADAAATAWAVEDVRRALDARWRGKRLLLLADCCHSGALGEIVAGYDGRKDVDAVCFPSALDCNVSTGNWTFTESIVSVLSGEDVPDRDDDGAIDVEETDAFVRREMRFRERQLTEARRSTGFPRDFVLATVDPAKKRDRIASPWQVGDYAEAEWKGTWYRARVLEADAERAKVRYLGWDASHDETVPFARLRAPQPLARKAGDQVEIEWKGRHWPGRVLEIREDFARVTYDGFGPEWDEWVTDARLRARRPTPR